jgi:hypothetical protein
MLYESNKGNRRVVEIVYVVVAAAILLVAVILVVPSEPEVNAVDDAVLVASLTLFDESRVHTFNVAMAALGGCPGLTKELI